MSYHFTPKVKVYPGDREADIFNNYDRDFMNSPTENNRPPEFNLHLAIYIFNCESLPDYLLEPLKQWVKDNKKAGSKIPNLLT
jgi:hypothetical protein